METPDFYKDKDVLGMSKEPLPRSTDINYTSGSEPRDEEGHVYEDASKTRRFCGYLVDIAGFYAFAFLVGAVIGLLGMMSALEKVNDNVLGIFLMLIYYCLMEGAAGRTLGKFATGTKVITADGQKPGFGKVLGRTLCRFIPFEPFSFFGSGPGGWHDSITDTRVVLVK